MKPKTQLSVEDCTMKHIAYFFYIITISVFSLIPVFSWISLVFDIVNIFKLHFIFDIYFPSIVFLFWTIFPILEIWPKEAIHWLNTF